MASDGTITITIDIVDQAIDGEGVSKSGSFLKNLSQNKLNTNKWLKSGISAAIPGSSVGAFIVRKSLTKYTTSFANQVMKSQLKGGINKSTNTIARITNRLQRF